MAVDISRKRGSRLSSVDKANVLECTELWRGTRQLVRAPKQLDVMVTRNMFGEILSDRAAMALRGSKDPAVNLELTLN